MLNKHQFPSTFCSYFCSYFFYLAPYSYSYFYKSSKFPSSSSSSPPNPCPVPKSKYNKRFTLHLWRVEASKSFVRILLLLLIFVNPLGPIDLNILVFVLRFNQPRPEWSLSILLLEHHKQMEASFAPLRVIRINLRKELKFQSILFASAFALEFEMSGCKFYFLVDDVHKVYLHKDSIFTLCPLGDWMSK